jgi:hypothetical protein
MPPGDDARGSCHRRRTRWEVYTTFYVPTTTLWIIGAAIIVLVGLGVWGIVRLVPADNRSL